MILTVTPNPSIDRTLHIPSLSRGEVTRAVAATAEAGGKGLNVSRALATHGYRTIAIVPLSPPSAAAYEELVAGSTTLEVVEAVGGVRINISLVEPDGTVTKINEPGPTMSPRVRDALLERVASVVDGASWVVGSGSLPPGIEADFYGRLAHRLRGRAFVAIDADGAALREALTEGVALVKPNRRELEGLAGRPLSTIGEIVAAARELVHAGAVLVSLGPDGAVLVDRHGETHAEARPPDVLNTVGAGDALLAGFLAGGANAAALPSAVAWSVAACRSAGTQMRPVGPADLAAVVVHPTAQATRLLAA